MSRTNTGSTSNWLSHSGVSVTAAPVTLAGWIRPANLTANMNIVNVGVGNNQYFALAFDGANAYALGDNVAIFDVNAGGGGNAIVASPAVRPADAARWIHCAGVARSSSSRLAYLNGHPGSVETSSVTPAGINRINIGAYDDTNTRFSPLNGAIGEVAIWNIDLSTGEIQRLAAGEPPSNVRPRNLVCYWDLRSTDLRSYRRNFLLTINGAMPLLAQNPPIVIPRRRLVVMPAAAPGGARVLPPFLSAAFNAGLVLHGPLH